MAKSGTTGVLLVNLGTPDSPTPSAVKRYLREFLLDRRVVEIPRPIWWLILNLIILNIRPQKTARLYKKIWSNQGSPLLVESESLGRALENNLRSKSNRFEVVVAMRYGSPSISEGMERLRDLELAQLLVLPLYPQYSSATIGSVVDGVAKVLKSWRYIPPVNILGDYHDDEFYIQAVADKIQSFWAKKGKGNILLLSFHGLPERSRALGDPYYEQCQQTAKLIALELALDEKQWKLVFQSRFGYEEWLKPYCSEVLKQLPEQGVKKVDIVCPGFAVDCLETLEEMAIQNRQLFLQSGGVDYRYIPALNSERSHVDALSRIVLENNSFLLK